MEYRSYNKIHRIGKEDVDGILCGQCYVQEKLDGANSVIFLKDDGSLGLGSRNRELSEEESFNGFREYIEGHAGIRSLLRDNPEWILYGEWLVRHSIPYPETAYKKFYLFDIKVGDRFLTLDEVYNHAHKYEIEVPHLFGLYENPTAEQLKELCGQSKVGEVGEGIVIKNFDFVNKWGRTEYAKLVTEKFKEVNAITFGGNNKHSESYWEMFIVNKYLTLGRVQKVMNKIQPLIDKRLDLEHTPRIAGTVIHDMITEEAYEIFKKVPVVDNNRLRRLAMKKAVQIYHDILNNDISVADK